MALGRPSITTPSNLELRGVQSAIANTRQRIEAIEAEVARVAGQAGQTAYSGGAGGSVGSTIAIASLQTSVTALTARVTTLEGSVTALQASDAVQDGQISALQYDVAAAQHDISVLSGMVSGLVYDINRFDLRRQCLDLFVGDETTAITVGTAKLTRRAPFAFTITDVRASLSTAQATGSIFTVNVLKNGTTIFSTKITIDNTERTSTTAAALPVLSTTALTSDDELTVDVDQVGDGTAKGLKVYLIGTT
jgi:hypothetical protein